MILTALFFFCMINNFGTVLGTNWEDFTLTRSEFPLHHVNAKQLLSILIFHRAVISLRLAVFDEQLKACHSSPDSASSSLLISFNFHHSARCGQAWSSIGVRSTQTGWINGSAWVLWVEEKGERSSRFHLRQLDELGRQQAELDP